MLSWQGSLTISRADRSLLDNNSFLFQGENLMRHQLRGGDRAHFRRVAWGIGWLLLRSPAGFPELPQLPPSSFLWGFCQAYDGKRGEVFPLSRPELEKLRDELGINALRFWVSPAWVGWPQQTFNGPEAIDYTRFGPADYVWRDPAPAIDSLDELLDWLHELGIHPVLMVWPVHEYVQYLARDDLTFLNDPPTGWITPGFVR